jgi:DNA primase
MPLYAKESLETLRQRVDIVDVLEPYIELKRAGAQYKALCPFHDEKNPSFTVQKGDKHYHCFGCQAHGDAIEFLMSYLKLSFNDAIEHLAEKFHIHLERVESKEQESGPKRSTIKQALEQACLLYQYTLTLTEEGRAPLQYLINRGMSLDFIQTFRIGFAPNISGYTRKILHAKGFSDEVLLAAGLIAKSDTGRSRDFFSERITFPIHDPQGQVIGFSARKYMDETYGGKYINTSETPLFKKSKVLFGLNYSRRRIAKERQAIIVEGQVDALRLIDSGFDYTVAGQGTAFGTGHVEELLHLGVQKVFLVMDQDRAGQEACCKIGDLFQRKGVEVIVPLLPLGKDPDDFIRLKGGDAFSKVLEEGVDFITFLVSHLGKTYDIKSPAGKNQLVQQLSLQINGWDSELMVHESKKKMAALLNISEHFAGVGLAHIPQVFLKKSDSIALPKINAARILESDLIRWLLYPKEQARFIEIAKKHLKAEDFQDPVCKKVFLICSQQEGVDLLLLAQDHEIQDLINEFSSKLIQKEKAVPHFIQTIQKLLDRSWMEKRERIRQLILGGELSDEEALLKLKEFDALKHEKPQVCIDEPASCVL